MATGDLSVRVLLFARLRELAGSDEMTVDVPAPATVQSVWAATVQAHPRLEGSEAGIRAALNERYAAWDAGVERDDTVAFLPPVSGGTDVADRPRVYAIITGEPLNAGLAEDLIRSPADGAICTFTGVVRDNSDGRAVTHLEYEAYREMAETEMRRIGEETRTRFGVTGVAVMHRIGEVKVGEASVVVTVSAPHRAEAFEACRHAIDQVKATAPIWKKEHGPDGATWSEPAAAEAAG